jgi:hypothetical protein
LHKGARRVVHRMVAVERRHGQRRPRGQRQHRQNREEFAPL